MLVITRRSREQLLIGDDITIVILGIKGNQVRLGIEAPPHIQIDREEIRERKDNDNYVHPYKDPNS